MSLGGYDFRFYPFAHTSVQLSAIWMGLQWPTSSLTRGRTISHDLSQEEMSSLERSNPKWLISFVWVYLKTFLDCLVLNVFGILDTEQKIGAL